LVILESDSLHQAKQGILPRWVLERYREGALEPIAQDAVTEHG
jgi:hypothetical protein